MAIKLWTEKIKKLIYSVAKMNKYWDKFYLPDFRHLVLELQQQDIKGGDLSTDQQSAELSAVKISISAWSFWLILLCRIMLPLSHCWRLSNIFLLTLFYAIYRKKTFLCHRIAFNASKKLVINMLIQCIFIFVHWLGLKFINFCRVEGVISFHNHLLDHSSSYFIFKFPHFWMVFPYQCRT